MHEIRNLILMQNKMHERRDLIQKKFKNISKLQLIAYIKNTRYMNFQLYKRYI